jgi:integrase
MARRGNNEGSIRKRADGTWEARVSLPTGDRKSLYGKTRQEVAAKLTAVMRDVQQGLPVPTERQTLAAFLADWLASVVRGRVEPTTYTRYALDVRRITAALGRLKLSEVTPQRIQAFLNSLREQGLSASSVKHCRAVLRSALGQAETWNLIARNPAAGKRVTSPRGERYEIEALSITQARAIMAAFVGHPFEALVHTALATGLRQGELLGLRWQDLDLDAGTLTVRVQLQRVDGVRRLKEPKSDRSRRALPLPPSAVEALRQHRRRQLEARLSAGATWQETGHVFTTSVGTPFDNSNVIHRFHRQLAKAGLPRMRFHDLRHGAASVLLQSGLSLREIMEILGHSQIGITANLYTHIAPEMKRDAAAKMEAALWGTG